jgi:capsule polysaccharide export protein KpsE/RkpR
MTQETRTEWFVWALPLLWRSRRRLLIVAAAGCLLSCLVVFLIPRRYKSMVRLMPPDAQSAMGFASMASALSGIPPSVTGGGLASLVNSRSPNAVFLAIVGSRTAQDDLINRFDLKKVYGCRTSGCARKMLSKRTGVDEDKKTGVVTIAVTDKDPVRARELAGAYVDELNKLVVVMDTSSAHRERVFLEQQLQKVKQNLDLASVQLSLFSSSHATMDVQRQGSAMLDAATKLQGELAVAQSELSELRAAYSPENYRVQEAQARVTSLTQELQKLGGGTNETSSDPGPDQIFPSLRELPLLGVTYTDLYRSVRLDETVYETLTKQYALAKVEEAKETPTVTVLDEPDLPEKRTFQVWVAMIFCGTLLALLGGAAWMIGREFWRRLDSSCGGKAVFLEMLAGFREAESPAVAARPTS